MNTWFITGTSRGIGLEIAREALRRGDRVVATARNATQAAASLEGSSESLLVCEVDVTREASISSAVAEAVRTFGTLDVLVNNAGYGLIGAVEEVGDSAARAMFDVNVFGLMSVSRAVLPHMRAQRSGRIINVSSVAGLDAPAGSGVYAASKHAVEALGSALRVETAALGIHVTTIEPGRFRTDFLDESSLVVESGAVLDYADTLDLTPERIALTNHTQQGDPRKLARAVADLVELNSPPARLLLGSDAVSRYRAHLQHELLELDKWQEVSVSTDFDE